MSSRVKPLGNALRLEVEGDPAPGTLVNLIPNPSGELGGYGWITPIDGSWMRSTVGADGLTYLAYAASGAVGQEFYSTPVRVDADQYIKAAWTVSGPESAPGAEYTVGLDWLDDAGEQVASSLGVPHLATPTTPRTVSIAPPGILIGDATQARLHISWGNPTAPGRVLAMRGVQLVAADTAAGLDVPIVPLSWVNVLGSTHDITVTRERFNVSTLSAVVIDSDLDPAQASSIIEPGRLVRLTAYGDIGQETDEPRWRPIFTGKLTGATVDYQLKEQNADKRARIELAAADTVQTLTNSTSSEGVSHIDELPYVLEKMTPAVPWNCNGNSGGVGAVTIVETSDQTSAMDQLALTRDTRLGYVWVDNEGVVQCWDRDRIPAFPLMPMLDEDRYNDVVVGYDTDVVINEVVVTNNEYDAVDETNTVTTYGPYLNQASIDEWRGHRAEFTTHGLLPEEIAEYAQQVLRANAQPVVRLTSMRLHVDVSDDPFEEVMSPHAFVDLYDYVELTCERANMDQQPARVVSIEHTISGPDSKWLMTLGFNTPASYRRLPTPRDVAADGDVVDATWPVELPTQRAGGGTTTILGGGGGGGTPLPPAGVVLHFPIPDVLWLGVHGLGQSPVDVTLMNVDGEKFGGSVSYPDADTVKADFGVAVAGSMLVQK